jgi:hypothetical protein
MTQKQGHEANEFLTESQARRTGLTREFLDFVRHNKKWWLIPILVVIFLVGLLVVLGGTGTAPFIYALF